MQSESSKNIPQQDVSIISLPQSSGKPSEVEAESV